MLEALSFLLGFVTTGIVFMFLMPLFPTLIEQLSNRPNRFRYNNTDPEQYPASEFGFFTSVGPGQVKIIMAGDHFVRCLMNFPGHTFKGMAAEKKGEDIPQNSKEYWEVVSTTDEKLGNNENPYYKCADAHPVVSPNKRSLIKPLAWFFWIWETWVFRITGYVFVGWPFRHVMTYPITRVTHDFQSVKSDYSDFFRVSDFEFPVHIEEADTQDKVPVSIKLTNIVRVFNPFETAFETYNWAFRLTQAVSDCVTSYTRVRPLNEVLSAKEASKTNELPQEVMKIGNPHNEDDLVHDTVVSFGVKMVQVLLTDISVVEPTTEIKKKFADVAVARVDSEAKAERAKGDAAQIREQIQVVKAGGHYGLAVLAAERNVRTAQAAGAKAIVIVGGSGETDPVNAAMLQELKDINLRNELSRRT